MKRHFTNKIDQLVNSSFIWWIFMAPWLRARQCAACGSRYFHSCSTDEETEVRRGEEFAWKVAASGIKALSSAVCLMAFSFYQGFNKRGFWWGEVGGEDIGGSFLSLWVTTKAQARGTCDWVWCIWKRTAWCRLCHEELISRRCYWAPET